MGLLLVTGLLVRITSRFATLGARHGEKLATSAWPRAAGLLKGQLAFCNTILWSRPFRRHQLLLQRQHQRQRHRQVVWTWMMPQIAVTGRVLAIARLQANTMTT